MSVDALKIATGRASDDMMLERMVRVDHAGEYGAKRIYEGQLRVLGKKSCGDMIRHMRDQELEHLDYFEQQVRVRGVRPTALMPLWHVGGYAMGAITALMGEKAAMACTVAVESVIDQHYGHQLEALEVYPEEKKLAQSIEQFKAEEMEHHDLGLEHGAAQMPAYGALVAMVSGVTKSAIWLSKRL